MRLNALLAVSAVVLIVAAIASAATISKKATTASYSLTLNVGAMEAMYTPAQVKAKHPTTGEVMLGGSMMAGSMTAMKGAVERHLELHIHSRATGALVSKVMPAITVTDETGRTMPEELEVVAMEGVGQGSADLHYGNYVPLTIGHSYKVAVVVRGETATFSFKAV
jgi:hypothetical protein